MVDVLYKKLLCMMLGEIHKKLGGFGKKFYA